MKNCDAYEALLDAFAEGDLFTEDMMQVQQHLMKCPRCQAYVDDLLAIRAAFPSTEDEIVPEGFADTVMAVVAAHPQAAAVPAAATRKKPLRWMRVAAPLAACCAIVILLQGGPVRGGAAKPKLAAESTVSYSTTADMAAPVVAKAEEGAPRAEESAEAEPMEPAAAAPMEDSADIVVEPTAGAKIVSNDSPSYTAGSITADCAPYRIRITVDTAYIGNALDNYSPVSTAELSDGRTELRYELTTVQYEALLQMLADRDELPAEKEFETDSDLVLVIVRK